MNLVEFTRDDVPLVVWVSMILMSRTVRSRAGTWIEVQSRHEDFIGTHKWVKEGNVAKTSCDIPSSLLFSLTAVPSDGA
jgi:hypothetical protein